MIAAETCTVGTFAADRCAGEQSGRGHQQLGDSNPQRNERPERMLGVVRCGDDLRDAGASSLGREAPRRDRDGHDSDRSNQQRKPANRGDMSAESAIANWPFREKESDEADQDRAGAVAMRRRHIGEAGPWRLARTRSCAAVRSVLTRCADSAGNMGGGPRGATWRRSGSRSSRRTARGNPSAARRAIRMVRRGAA